MRICIDGESRTFTKILIETSQPVQWPNGRPPPRVTFRSPAVTTPPHVRNAQTSFADPSSWGRELRAIVALSWPLALANLTQVAMGTTDVMMMGWLSADTLAAGALGANLYFMAFIFGAGLLNAAAPMIARDLGRDPAATAPIRGTVRIALWSAFFVAVPFWLALWWSETPAASRWASIPAWRLWRAPTSIRCNGRCCPAWGFLVLRSFVSAVERPVWSFVVGVTAIGINAAANWCLMLGHWGFHSLGIAGSGLATLLSNLFMFSHSTIVVTMRGHSGAFACSPGSFAGMEHGCGSSGASACRWPRPSASRSRCSTPPSS